MNKSAVQNVDEYISNSPLEAQATLQEIRAVIRSAVPNVEESISWGVPFYKYHGALAGFAVYTHHVSFGLADSLTSEDRKTFEENGFPTGIKTIQIRFDQKVPATEIGRVLNEKAKLNEARSTGK